MKYRKLSPEGDYQFGHGNADFWRNQPEAVGQAVKTRLLLYRGEWFLDTQEGTPWGGFPFNELVAAQAEILGAHTALTRDLALKQRVLNTQGVVGIAEYASTFNPDTREFSVNMTLDTVYGGLVVTL